MDTATTTNLHTAPATDFPTDENTRSLRVSLPTVETSNQRRRVDEAKPTNRQKPVQQTINKDKSRNQEQNKGNQKGKKTERNERLEKKGQKKHQINWYPEVDFKSWATLV